MSAPRLGQFLGAKPTEHIGSHTVRRWELRTDEGFVDACAAYIAALYVTRPHAALAPHLQVGTRLPTKWNVRLGDFGEAVARAIHTDRLDRAFPLLRLHSHTTRNSTIQGPDGLAVSLGSPLDAPRPCVIEVKSRTGRVTASTLRKEIIDELRNLDHLDSAWMFAAQELANMPEPSKLRSWRIADRIVRDYSDGRSAHHSRHAVIVCDEDGVNAARFFQPEKATRWPESWDDSELDIVQCPGLSVLVADVFERASKLRLGEVLGVDIVDVVRGSLGIDPRDVPGNTSPLRPSLVARVSPKEDQVGIGALTDAACWYLADRDGLALAAAREAQRDETLPLVVALAKLLSGELPDTASHEDSPLQRFVEAVRRAWADPRDDAGIRAAENDLADSASANPHLRAALLLASASLRYRLVRHPVRLVAARGKHLEAVVDQLALCNVRALWPGQEHAISAGLLDSESRAFAVEMPTSAGKTTLIALACAAEMDRDSGGIAVVLCPTRALVDQAAADLSNLLGEGVVAAMHGGYDLDATDVSLADCGVAVMTPERFDLEIRLSSDTGSPLRDRVAVVVVDEAHMLNEPGRGARLELLLSRVCFEADARFVMFSSQLGDPTHILKWLEGSADATLSSDWRPTPLHRAVYYPEGGSGFLKWEHAGEPEAVLRIVASAPSRPPDNTLDLGDVPALLEAGPKKNDQVAALALKYVSDGLVLVFAGQARSVLGLAGDIRIALGRSLEPYEMPDEAEMLKDLEPVAAGLLACGIGVHYRSLHSDLRVAVERLARIDRLRVLVCTTTLAEGIDLPVKTVIVASRQLGPKTKLTPSKFANLSGRAGRGGRFRSGVVISVHDNKSKAEKLERDLANYAPATIGALGKGIAQLATEQAELLPNVSVPDERWRIADEVIIEALGDETLRDEELRSKIEAVLSRTLWRTHHADDLSERFLRPIVHRAIWVQSVASSGLIRAAFRRSALPVDVFEFLRSSLDAIGPRAVLDSITTPTTRRSLIRLALEAHQRGTDSAILERLTNAVVGWERGDDETDLIREFGDEWNQVTRLVQDILPWYLNSTLEIVCALAGVGDRQVQLDVRRRFATTQLRYGAPNVEVCSVIRAGLSRRRALQLYRDYQAFEPRDPFEVFWFSSFWWYLNLAAPTLSEGERARLHLQPGDG